jgi:putative flavoprotein involved in K+ transport
LVWATGFRFDFSWVDVPVFDEQGLPVHVRGITGARGLYFLELPWQHTPGSALLGWVGHDAKFIASEICSFWGIGFSSRS